jgi:hypothetical protein
MISWKKIALGESNSNRRGPSVEGEIHISMRKLDLPVDQWRRFLGHSKRDRQRGCGSNHYMRSCAKSTPGVRHICGGMHVRYLNRRAEKQKESATKSNGHPPGRSRVIFRLLKEHHYNYNVRRSFPVECLGDGLGNCLFPSSLGLKDKFYDFSRRALAASGLSYVVADCF